jgi:hypothetical protein
MIEEIYNKVKNWLLIEFRPFGIEFKIRNWHWVAVVVVLFVLLLIIIIASSKKKKKTPVIETTEETPVSTIPEIETLEEKKDIQKEEPTRSSEPVLEKPEEEKPLIKEKYVPPLPKKNVETIKPVKPSRTIYHLSKRKEDDKWVIKKEGSLKPIRIFDKQPEAVKWGEQWCNEHEATLVVHAASGEIRYGKNKAGK